MPLDDGSGRMKFKDRLAEDGQHGTVTAEELNALAARAARSAAGRLAFPAEERFEIAWEAIAERFCSSADPSRVELVRAGMDAIRGEYVALRHHHGIPKGFTSRDNTRRERFVTYWHFHAGATQSHETKVIDTVALGQILRTLPAAQRDALVALARHGDITSAARSLGKSRATVKVQLRLGRKRFLALWHEHEKPSRRWMRDGPGNPEGRRPRRTMSESLRLRRKRQQAGKASRP
jgi:hypothetical protein